MDNVKNDVYFIQKIRKDLEFITAHMKSVEIEELNADEVLLDSMMFRMIQILYEATLEPSYLAEAQRILQQIAYLVKEAGMHPYAHAMFLVALSDWVRPGQLITAVYRIAKDVAEIKQCFKYIPSDSTVRIVQGPTEEYPLKDEQVHYFVCENRSCLPPMNQAEFLRHLGAQRPFPEL